MPRHTGDEASRQRIAVVDGDAISSQRVAQALREQGYAVETIGGNRVIDAVERTPPDLLVLDVALPAPSSGWDLLARLRDFRVPVIVHSAQVDEHDRIVGLELGADDYVSKECSPRELVARVRAVLRRVGHLPAAQRVAYEGLVVDLHGRRAFVDGREVALRPKEFELLAFLARHPGRAFSRRQLLEHVWDSSAEWQNPETVTEHVRRLRQVIEAEPARPRRVVTVRGVGYRFEP